jgi:hypothetical protein
VENGQDTSSSSTQIGLINGNGAELNLFLSGTGYTADSRTNWGVISTSSAIAGLRLETKGTTSPLTFFQAAAEKMRIDSTGNVGIGITAPTQKLDVVGNIKTSGCLYYASSSLGTCASDERIKTDVRPFDLGLDALLGIRPVNFKYNGLAGFEADGKNQLGVIAQDIEQSAPELVEKREVKLHPEDHKKTEIKVVNYGAFTYVIINAVKQLYEKLVGVQEHQIQQDRHIASKVDKKELETLKSENAQLKARADKFEKENLEIKARLEKIEKMLKSK